MFFLFFCFELIRNMHEVFLRPCLSLICIRKLFTMFLIMSYFRSSVSAKLHCIICFRALALRPSKLKFNDKSNCIENLNVQLKLGAVPNIQGFVRNGNRACMFTNRNGAGCEYARTLSLPGGSNSNTIVRHNVLAI